MHIPEIDPDTADVADLVLCLQDLYAQVALLQEQVDSLSGR